MKIINKLLINILFYYFELIYGSETYKIASNDSNCDPVKPVGKEITVEGCGLSHVSNEGKIVGGKEAKIGQFPWQVWILIYSVGGGVEFCGGSIINEYWILTAAHCVSDERTGESNIESVEVHAGSHNIRANSSRTQKRFADCVIIHDKWFGQLAGFGDDIAMIRIPSDKPLNINHKTGGFVNGICLPPKTKPLFEYKGRARISGWGQTSQTGAQSVVLKYTDVTVISNNECKKYDFPLSILDGMICQGIDRTSPCFGDSGGPLITSVSSNDRKIMTQIGIVSFGVECASDRYPNTVYTKVSHYRDWIEDTIKRYDGNVGCGADKALRMRTTK